MALKVSEMLRVESKTIPEVIDEYAEVVGRYAKREETEADADIRPVLARVLHKTEQAIDADMTAVREVAELERDNKVMEAERSNPRRLERLKELGPVYNAVPIIGVTLTSGTGEIRRAHEALSALLEEQMRLSAPDRNQMRINDNLAAIRLRKVNHPHAFGYGGTKKSADELVHPATRAVQQGAHTRYVPGTEPQSPATIPAGSTRVSRAS
jgi:hypothetical protein